MEVDFDKGIKHAIRHDFHKMKGLPHDKNNPHQVVDLGADGHAGAMSRLKSDKKGKILAKIKNPRRKLIITDFHLSMDMTCLYETGGKRTVFAMKYAGISGIQTILQK